MYVRMMGVSERLQAAVEAGGDVELLDAARTELYRGQCNCSYWHGAFGGIYLPHLRNAVYRHLIAADNLLERAAGRPESWIDATVRDFNLDSRQEVQVTNDKLAVWISPYRGGMLYELDVRSIRVNLLATIARRPEAYHQKVLAGASGDGRPVSSIHDRIVFKQPGLERRLQYDAYPRKSLLDHVLDSHTTLAAMVSGQATQQGDFLLGAYEARVRRNPDRIQVQLSRTGQAWGSEVKITKGVTLESGGAVLEIAYLLEGLPTDRPCHFGIEFNFAALPAGAGDRYFHDGAGRRLGDLGRQLDLSNVASLHLTDEWLGIDVELAASLPTHFWTFPLETVSQSEGGFELVHQSVVVIPHWYIEADAKGRWSATFRLSLDASLAESRQQLPAAAASSGA
jgi:alpha-amylase